MKPHMTSCAILNELNNSSGHNRLCRALVVLVRCVVLLAKGRDILRVSGSEFEIYQLLSCEFWEILHNNNTSRLLLPLLYQTQLTHTRTHSGTWESRQHAISRYVIAFYVTSMNLMHSLTVCLQDRGSVDSASGLKSCDSERLHPQ